MSYGRRPAGGKMIRLDDPVPEYENPMTPMVPMDYDQQQNYGAATSAQGEYYDQQQQQQHQAEQQQGFDPMAYYKQQQQQMLLQASQHVQASQMEIQQAQYQAEQRQQQQSGGEDSTDVGVGGRRSRSAANAAKAAMSMMNETQSQIDAVVFDNGGVSVAPQSPAGGATGDAPVTVHRGRGRPRGSGRGRGRPPGSTAARMAQIRGTEMTSPEDRVKRKPGRKPITEIQAEDETSLYYIIRNGKASLQQVVDDWIDDYKSDRDKALLSLMQFFISASGCRGKITPQMQATMEHTDIIRCMTEEFEEESGEYPLVTAGQFWKKFRQNFCEFIQLLVKQCQYSIIYDQHLMDNVISLLTQLSDSQVRAFRHTATLAAMKLMTALVDVALTVSINMENTQRQYDAEQQKTRDKRATNRLEALMTRRQELEENTDEIKNMLTYMFKSVFVHRYRDTLPEIRSICMFEIGQWMKKFHQQFLDDTYLKYIGWTIHDKVGDVRLKCLQTLQPLYASEELKGKLELFTSKFKDRIVAMTLDKEFDVAVEAVKLVISIYRHHRDMLTDKDCENVYELVYSSHRAVAQAAGEFLNERLFLPDNEMDPDDVRTKRGKKRLPYTPLIRDLVEFMIESELHEHAAYLVDSLIESNAMMKDWECMTDLLLEEPGPREDALEDRQETSLIEIMVCCIRQATTREPPVGRGPTRNVVLSAKEKKQAQNDKQNLTTHFIQTLPPLLKKYLPDAEKITNLMVIPQYFDLEIYTTSRQEKNLDALLHLMIEIVEKHSEKEVLETCSKTLDRLCDEQYAIYSRCCVSRGKLLDMISTRYKEGIDEYMNLILGNEEPNEDERFNLVSSLRKIEAFSDCHNMAQYDVWESMFTLLVRYKNSMEFENKTMNVPPEAIKSALSACFNGLLYDQNYLENTAERDLTVSDVQILKDRLDRYVECVTEIMFLGNNVMLKEEGFTSICDLFIMFHPDAVSRNNAGVLAPLVLKSDQGMWQLLNDFIQNHVFISEDEKNEISTDHQNDHNTKIKELYKRRNFLASFCKLIVYNSLPTRTAADIFKHYVTFYNDYGDIIKATLEKVRENNKVNCAKTMVKAMYMKFKEIQQFQSVLQIDRNTVEFYALKELAKRFALSFGLDALKNREAIVQLHKEGILIAVNQKKTTEDPMGPPSNLSFLEIITEFSNKLFKQDKRLILNYLDKRISTGMIPSSCGEENWQQPLILYRNSLVHGKSDEISIITS